MITTITTVCIDVFDISLILMEEGNEGGVGSTTSQMLGLHAEPSHVAVVNNLVSYLEFHPANFEQFHILSNPSLLVTMKVHGYG